MLGPVRFEHIKDCARDAIKRYLLEEEKKAKRMKVEEEDNKRQDLIRVLQERDRSIVVLRDLLAEKQQRDNSQEVQKSSSAKVSKYAELSLPTLANLEKARDATLGWILNQIEKAEAAQEELAKEVKPKIKDPGTNHGDAKADGAKEVLKASKLLQ